MAVCGVGSAWPAVARPGASPLVGELQQVRDEFRQVASDAAAIAAPLTEAQFAWRPAADAWSIGECLSHLNATARVCLPKLDEAISDGIRGGRYGEGPFRYGWVDRLILRASEPPSRWHMWSPAAFLPAHGEPRDEVLRTFEEFQDEFIRHLRSADGLDLVRVRVTSPIAGWRRFSLGAAFAVIAAHERRHLWQARSVAALPHFPR